LDHTTDPDTAASFDAAAVRGSAAEMDFYAFCEKLGGKRFRLSPAQRALAAAWLDRVVPPPKVWRDEPCPHHSRMMPNIRCRACGGTGRLLEPASS
jgi:hypothetical protein